MLILKANQRKEKAKVYMIMKLIAMLKKKMKAHRQKRFEKLLETKMYVQTDDD